MALTAADFARFGRIAPFRGSNQLQPYDVAGARDRKQAQGRELAFRREQEAQRAQDFARRMGLQETQFEAAQDERRRQAQSDLLKRINKAEDEEDIDALKALTPEAEALGLQAGYESPQAAAVPEAAVEPEGDMLGAMGSAVGTAFAPKVDEQREAKGLVDKMLGALPSLPWEKPEAPTAPGPQAPAESGAPEEPHLSQDYVIRDRSGKEVYRSGAAKRAAVRGKRFKGYLQGEGAGLEGELKSAWEEAGKIVVDKNLTFPEARKEHTRLFLELAKMKAQEQRAQMAASRPRGGSGRAPTSSEFDKGARMMKSYVQTKARELIDSYTDLKDSLATMGKNGTLSAIAVKKLASSLEPGRLSNQDVEMLYGWNGLWDQAKQQFSVQAYNDMSQARKRKFTAALVELKKRKKLAIAAAMKGAQQLIGGAAGGTTPEYQQGLRSIYDANFRRFVGTGTGKKTKKRGDAGAEAEFF